MVELIYSRKTVNDMAEKDLLSVKWSEFSVGELFDIQRGQRLVKREQRPGKVPYISSSAIKNGVDNMIAPPDKMKRFKGCLTITNSGSVGTAFYHPYEFVASDHVTCLQNENLNEFNSKFIIPILNRLSEKYSFNREINNARLDKEIIILPEKNGDPDWDFMRDYMKLVFEKIKPKKGFTPHAIHDDRELSELTWGEFTIEELFDSKIGKNLDGNKIDKNGGTTPYITRKETINGLDGFIDWDDEKYLNKVSKPVITIGNETAQPFVQEYDFFTGTKVNILTPRYNANKYHMLFVCRSLEQNKSKYSYSYSINSTRLKKQTLLLPVLEDGKPDWDFMEQFMMRMENKVHRQIKFEKPSTHNGVESAMA